MTYWSTQDGLLGIVVLAHFCEEHGPSVSYATQLFEHDSYLLKSYQFEESVIACSASKAAEARTEPQVSSPSPSLPALKFSPSSGILGSPCSAQSKPHPISPSSSRSTLSPLSSSGRDQIEFEGRLSRVELSESSFFAQQHQSCTVVDARAAAARMRSSSLTIPSTPVRGSVAACGITGSSFTASSSSSAVASTPAESMESPLSKRERTFFRTRSFSERSLLLGSVSVLNAHDNQNTDLDATSPSACTGMFLSSSSRLSTPYSSMPQAKDNGSPNGTQSPQSMSTLSPSRWRRGPSTPTRLSSRPPSKKCVMCQSVPGL